MTVVGRHVFDMTDDWDGKPPGGMDHVVVVTHRPAPEGWDSQVFETGNPDPACAVTSHVSWRNVDTGAAGEADVTVPGYSEPDKNGTAGFVRENLPTGPGLVVVQVSSNPNPAEVEVQAY
ncbi:hypothetical protein GCM10023318_01640 [Nocardia callitridis]|uniref:Uncharacterized protein n=1 Tax=Nocardia callitridis TaxID=648753 RepID=A0ABP9JTP5_9NOCA